MKKRFYIQYLFIIFLIILLSTVFMPNYAKATYSLEYLRNQYPTGMQWNDNYHGSTQCHGFAGLIYDSYYGINPFQYAEKVNDVDKIEPGDIVRYNGHTVFVLTRNGENTTVVECNYDWNNHVRWDAQKSISEYRNNFEYILKAPYVLGTTQKKPEKPANLIVDTSNGVKVSWSKSSNCYGYKLEVYNSSGEKITELELKKATSTSTNIYSLKTGTYTVKVCAIGLNGLLSDYSSATFSCMQEAESCYISPEKKILPIGESFTFKVTYRPANGIAQSYFYAGEDTDQSIIKIESNGTITALKEGTTKVYFSFKTSRSSMRNSYQVKVITPLKLKESEKKLKTGETSKINLSSYSQESNVSWSSDNSKVVTVDNYGNITAKASGTARITANQIVYNSDKSDFVNTKDYCYITVEDSKSQEDIVPVTGITLNESELTITAESEKTLVATVIPDTASNKKINWTTSDNSIVTVSETGVIKGVKVSKNPVTITATTEDGKYSATCKVTVVCAHTNTTTHEEVPSTCETQGVGRYVECEDCGKIIEGSNKQLELADHTYGDLIAKREPVHEENSLEAGMEAHYVCSVCGKYFNENHEEVKQEDLTIDAPTHQYGDWTTNTTSHWKECECGKIIDKTEHSGGIATCTRRAKCEICGVEYGELDSTNHVNKETITEKEATCTEVGLTGEEWCKDCGTKLSDGTEIPATGHRGGEANCAQGAICEVCGVEYTETDENNHVNTEVKDAKEATCTENGYTGDLWCTDCNKEIEKGKEIPATGHKGGTANSTTGAICEICGIEYTKKLDEETHTTQDNITFQDNYLKAEKTITIRQNANEKSVSFISLLADIINSAFQNKFPEIKITSKLTGNIGTGKVVELSNGDNITVIYKGDVNGDGKVSIADAGMMVRSSFGKIKLTEAQQKAGDIGGKVGEVNSSDAGVVVRLLFGGENSEKAYNKIAEYMPEDM